MRDAIEKREFFDKAVFCSMHTEKHSELRKRFIECRQHYDERFERLHESFKQSLEKLEKVMETIANKMEIMANCLGESVHTENHEFPAVEAASQMKTNK